MERHDNIIRAMVINVLVVVEQKILLLLLGLEIISTAENGSYFNAEQAELHSHSHSHSHDPDSHLSLLFSFWFVRLLLLTGAVDKASTIYTVSCLPISSASCDSQRV